MEKKDIDKQNLFSEIILQLDVIFNLNLMLDMLAHKNFNIGYFVDFYLLLTYLPLAGILLLVL